MKNSLFELLMDLFEKTIAELRASYPESAQKNNLPAIAQHEVITEDAHRQPSLQIALLKPASSFAFRVFTSEERARLTKASNQLLHRLLLWGVVSPEMMEIILNRLMISDSRMLDVQEVKWTVRNTMANTLDSEQLAFLDLVLYQKEHDFVMN